MNFFIVVIFLAEIKGDQSMKQAFIVGGTGMLKDVSKWLIENYTYTTVLARNKERLNLLTSVNIQTNLQLLALDYKNTKRLREAISHTIKQNGPIDVLVTWIHSDAPQAIPGILEEIGINQEQTFHYYHIKGSSHHLNSIISPISVPSHCDYHEIQLGFVIEGETSRWLTHDEISKGVISAIKDQRRETVIGQLEPWEARPSFYDEKG